jgi:DNA primase
MPFVNFAELKTRVSIEQAAQMLGLNLVLHGNQYRGACPVCKTGGDRALIVTPAKGLFYCFANKTGVDAIALTAHIRGTFTKEAAAELDRAFGTVQNNTGTVSKSRATAPQAPEARKQPAFDPEAYASRLDASHASLAPLGIPVEARIKRQFPEP